MPATRCLVASLTFEPPALPRDSGKGGSAVNGPTLDGLGMTSPGLWLPASKNGCRSSGLRISW